jgi:Domain of unknown function (DUF4062)
MPNMPLRRLRVMISSTRKDLRQYRDEASRIIKKVAEEKEKSAQLIEVSMERETQSGDREFAVAVSKRWVNESDWIVLIIGWNYGTISDEEGADGLSVTEWEYRYAIDQGKKVFVFIAGELESANEYRHSDEEQVDLKNSYFLQTDAQREKLRRFKDDLARAFVDYFKNLAHFRNRLEKTLKEAIDDLPPVVQPGSKLADLILAVTPAIQNCILQVNRLAVCKKIHDCLHDLRHKVIRRLRDELLPIWRNDGTLSDRKVGFISNRSNDAQRLLGRIKGIQDLIAIGNTELIRRIDYLLDLPMFWDGENSWPTSDQFAETVDDFTAAVQAAFTEADNAMRLEERALYNLHTRLLEQIGRTPERWALSPAEEKTLASEIQRIAVNENRLANALTAHHDWQRAHDRLDVLQGFRETNRFERKLQAFINTDRKTLLQLVKQELDTLASGGTGNIQASQATDERAASFAILSTAPHFGHDNDDLRADLQRLNDLLDTIGERIDAEAFDRLRARFDDAFYRIDKSTKAEVARAQDRVVGFEHFLRELATRAEELPQRLQHDQLL